MSENQNPERQQFGISGLPKAWGVVVQLVGTFGLAVFLVLYYVLYMHPNETEKFDNLRRSMDELTNSVDALTGHVEKQLSLLSNQQANSLEELFVSAVASEYCVRAVRNKEFARDAAETAKMLRQFNQIYLPHKK